MSGEHEVSNLDSKLKLGLVLNTGFTIFEFIIGFMSGSLALVSDAAHNLTDSLSLLISFFANKMASRQADTEKTFGYGRITILAALLNTFILFALAIYIFYEAYRRFSQPQPVEGGLVMIVAFVGIIINSSVAFLFVKNRDDINMRSAFLSMTLDAFASVGALIAGLIILVTGKTMVDPLISLIIGFMLIFSAWGIVKDALHILLEGVPEGLDPQQVKNTILMDPMIKGLDDLHIWAISSQNAALSCHVIIKPCSLQKSIELVENIKERLRIKFHIEHATIETELQEGPHDKERTDEGL